MSNLFDNLSSKIQQLSNRVAKDSKKFIKHYENFESKYIELLWEIPFTDFAKYVDLNFWLIAQGPACFEIDTWEDYEQALSSFLENKNSY